MTVTTQQVTRIKFALNVLIKEGLGSIDKMTHMIHLCRWVAVIEIKRDACF